MSQRTGFVLVFLTALASGASIFANSFAVQGFNPFVFSFLKNAVVAAFLLSAILLLKEFPSLKAISKKQAAQLASIGLVGGSIPFLLFFYALSLTSAVNAGFIHKTLFIWASAFAFLFLKEKIDRRFIFAAFLLLAGNFLLFQISSFGFPEALILLATILWAAENTISKHALKELPGSIVAFGRMFFGSLFILAFLAFTRQLGQALILSVSQIQWVLVSSAFLSAYVLTWYSGLKHVPLHKAASVLLIAQPVTGLLSFAFAGTALSLSDALGFLLILMGVSLLLGLGFLLNAAKSRGFALAPARN